MVLCILVLPVSWTRKCADTSTTPSRWMHCSQNSNSLSVIPVPPSSLMTTSISFNNSPMTGGYFHVLETTRMVASYRCRSLTVLRLCSQTGNRVSFHSGFLDHVATNMFMHRSIILLVAITHLTCSMLIVLIIMLYP